MVRIPRTSERRDRPETAAAGRVRVPLARLFIAHATPADAAEVATRNQWDWVSFRFIFWNLDVLR